MPILTITFDNGTEFAQHKQMSEDLNAAIYFANPYHSWERGTNENTNGLVRRFFPKGTDFDTISEEQISEAQQKINNRPRKRLGFLSPIEAINLHQSQLNNVAFTT
ncbi:MAG: IS30 family transposase [Sphingobacteriales bacterium]|nr:IS30 family transposase [Sphingobacteriales bacterium]MBK8473762.1 IS30 family transposase [Sphingobacteriales bacterium]